MSQRTPSPALRRRIQAKMTRDRHARLDRYMQAVYGGRWHFHRTLVDFNGLLRLQGNE